MFGAPVQVSASTVRCVSWELSHISSSFHTALNAGALKLLSRILFRLLFHLLLRIDTVWANSPEITKLFGGLIISIGENTTSFPDIIIIINLISSFPTADYQREVEVFFHQGIVDTLSF